MAENPHEKFIENVKISLNSVLVVARWAVLSGRDVKITGMKFADCHAEWRESADDGADVEINGRTVNVKASSRHFDSVAEFAEKFSTFERPIIVAATHVKTPDAYLILNKTKTGALVIKAETKPKWGERDVFDARYGTTQRVYDVAASDVSWLALIEPRAEFTEAAE